MAILGPDTVLGTKGEEWMASHGEGQKQWSAGCEYRQCGGRRGRGDATGLRLTSWAWRDGRRHASRGRLWLGWPVWLAARYGCAVVNLKCRIGWAQACDGSVCSAHVMSVGKGGRELATRGGRRCVFAKKQLETSSGSEACTWHIPGLLPAWRAQNVLQ